MSTTTPRRVVSRASHGAVSLTAGFIAGLVMFLAVGAATGDAVFSALSLAVLVTLGRYLNR
jgi:hypothetical protein